MRNRFVGVRFGSLEFVKEPVRQPRADVRWTDAGHGGFAKITSKIQNNHSSFASTPRYPHDKTTVGRAPQRS